MTQHISIQIVKINGAGRLAKISTSSTMQIGNHVKNHRNQGFGEFTGDRGKVHFPTLHVDDSDLDDSSAEKVN